MDLQATSVLSLFDTTKEQRKSFSENVIARIKSGEVNPLTIHIQAKCLEETIKGLLGNQEYKDYVLEEAQKHGGKSFEVHNAQVTIKETGLTYNYEQCNDPVHAELKLEFLNIKEGLDERESFLKKIPAKGIEIRFNDELVTIYPPSKSSTTSTVVSLK